MAVTKRVALVGAASCWGAQDYRCETGPLVVRSRGLVPRLQQTGYGVSWKQFVQPYLSIDEDRKLSIISDYCEALAQYVNDKVREGSFVVVIGGDHSVAMGTWSGVHQATREQGRLGLIWIDAHLDSHTSETSPSGAVHGMPLAALLGYGEPALVDIAGRSPKLLPQDVCIIGARSYEPAEEALLKKLGVRVYFMEEVRRRGIDEVLREAQRIVAEETAGFGVSIDLDAIDPREAPGVGSPERDGLDGVALVNALQRFKGDDQLLGIEVAELNPTRDRNDQTATLVVELVSAVT